jgi:ribonuclease D
MNFPFLRAWFFYSLRVIDTDSKLAGCLPELHVASWVALDTEADSLHAYPEKLCLLQVGVPGRELLVDPLAGLSLGPFWKVLQKHQLILHGADYDLRLLHKAGGFVPEAIFDTMLAARLLGCRQFGLTDLVMEYLGVPLEKGPQKANWARRPLTPRMETYALNDVRYLQPLAECLRGQLAEKGRLEWHGESCRRLIADCSVRRQIDPDRVWRVKGSHQLSPTALAVLREIWHWREVEAVRANKPPYFILAPTAMVGLAAAAAAHASLEEHLPRHFSERRRTGLEEAVRRGLANPNPPAVLRRTARRATEMEKRRVRELEQRRDRWAEELGFDPTLIASWATLMALARDWERHQGDLMCWQLDLLAPGTK